MTIADEITFSRSSMSEPFKPASEEAVKIQPCENGFVVGLAFYEPRPHEANYHVFESFDGLVEHLRAKYVGVPGKP